VNTLAVGVVRASRFSSTSALRPVFLLPRVWAEPRVRVADRLPKNREKVNISTLHVAIDGNAPAPTSLEKRLDAVPMRWEELTFHAVSRTQGVHGKQTLC
jgi:hypothetical protein